MAAFFIFILSKVNQRFSKIKYEKNPSLNDEFPLIVISKNFNKKILS